MKTVVQFVSLLILLSVFDASTGAGDPAMRKQPSIDVGRAIAIADGALGDRERPSDVELVTAKLYSTSANEITEGQALSNDELKKKLSGRIYWMIYYRSRTTDLGGDIGIFVDAADGRVVHVYRGR